MKIIKIILVLVLVFPAMQTFSQNPTQTIRGKVVYKDTRYPLIGANIVLLGVNPLMGASTDMESTFQIENAPIGRYSIKVSYIGYKEIIIPEVTVTAGKEVNLTLELTELANSLSEVIITASTSKDQPLNSMATVSARSFSVEEASRYAGSFADPARMASSFAGVVSSNSFTNEISVRGNAPTGLLWRVEGVEIPTPNHLSGYASNGGVVTVLSPNAMGNSDFMTGAYPAEYGNATSGVFDIKLRKGNEQQREYSFQASLFGLEASAEGPVKKGAEASYLVNYRYSTTSLFGDIGLLDKNEGLPIWQDLNLKLVFPAKKMGEFSLFAIGGLSGVTEAVQKDHAQWEYQNDNVNSQFHSNMGVVGASNKISLTPKTYLNTVASFSVRETGFNADSLDTQYQSHFNGKSDTKDYVATISSYVNHKLNASTFLRAGAIATHQSYDVYADDRSPVAPYEMKTQVDSKGDYVALQAFAQVKYRLAQDLELNAGLHTIYTQFNSNTSIEPRAALRWEIDSNQSINFGFGMHSRLAPASIYFEEVEISGVVTTPNISLEPSRSNHYVIGYNRTIGDHMRLKLEAYYQEQRHIPIADDPTSSFSIINNSRPTTGLSLVNKGTATNTGLELTLEKFFDNSYYFLLTGSLYDATYTGGDGVKRDSRYNGNIVTNFIIGKEFQLQNSRSFGIDFRFVVAGGNRITPVDLEESKLNRTTIYQEDKAYSDQAPMYFRPDFKISLTKNKAHSKRILSLDIQNVLNYQNLASMEFDPRKGEVVKNYQFGLLPNISYRMFF